MTTLTQTGIDEGLVYNAAGTNITEYPNGARNTQVGSYFYDFSGLTGNGVLYTNELAIVISDGRFMSDDASDQTLAADDPFDMDEAEGNIDQNSKGLDRKGYSTTVTKVSARFRFGCPSYDDVNVHETLVNLDAVPVQVGTNGYINPEVEPIMLSEWLDAQDASAGEVALATDSWWNLRAYLRWSLHWALYIVPLEEAAGEAEDDDLAQAYLGQGGDAPGVLPLNQFHEPVPSMGPAGMLYALGGGPWWADTVNPYEWPEAAWPRLWEAGPAWYRPIRRGTIANLPYAMVTAGNDYEFDAAAHYELDTLDGDTDIVGPAGTRDDTPDVRAVGKEVSLRIRIDNLNIHVGPHEMLILHVQSGRARLQAPTVAATGAPDVTPGLVIGAGQPALGPNMTLHQHYVAASARHTRLPLV